MQYIQDRISSCLLCLICLLVLPAGAIGQSGSGYDYFNRWYRFDQNYIKILVAEDGLYRVSQSDLQSAGVNVAGLVPANLQVFFRGEEVPVRVRTLGNDLDYFEFVGKRNDGRIDSLMYRKPSSPFRHDANQQPNVHSSFYNDSTAYFVTWDSVGTERYSTIQSTNFSAFNIEPWYRYQVLQEFKTRYFKGGGGSTNSNHRLNTDFITGEGFVGNEFVDGGNQDAAAVFVPTPGFVNSGTPIDMETRVLHTTTSSHILGVQVDNQMRHRDTTSGINIGTRSFGFGGPLPNSTLVRYLAYGGAGNTRDRGRPCWLTLTYDRLFDLDGTNTTEIHDWTRLDTAYMRFTNADVSSEAWIYDETSGQIVEGLVSNDTLHFLVPGFPGARKLRLFTDQAIKVPVVEPRSSLANLSDVNGGAQFVIVTHRKFKTSAEEYALYRDTSSVNRLSSKVVYIDEIYDEFGYGSMTPWAIKNFCKYAIDHWATKPQFVLLWGKGRAAPREVNGNQHNYVPTLGEPANDYEYVSNFSRNTPDLVPQAAIGRVCIYDDEEGISYLNKVRQYEHMEPAEWTKEMVFIGGGKTYNEQARIGSALGGLYIPYITDGTIGGRVHYYQKSNTGSTSNSEFTTEERINAGAGIIHFFGHSSTNIFDVDILEAKLYQNYDRIPFMIAFGCHGGDFDNSSQSFGERFLLEPSRGSIGYLANTTAGFLESLRDYGEDLYEQMFVHHYGEAIGTVLRFTIEQYAISENFNTDIFTTNHAKQLNLQGDPSVILRFPTQPDLKIEESDLFFTPDNLSALDNDYDLNLIVHNDGRTFADSFQLRIEHRPPAGEAIVYPPRLYPPISYRDTLVYNIPNELGKDMAGLNQYDVFVDALDSLVEYKESNNRIVHDEVVQGNIPAVVSPYEFAIVDSSRVKLVASTWIIERREQIRYVFEIDTTYDFTSPFKQGSGVLVGSSAYAAYEPDFDLIPGQVYYWRVRLGDIYPMQWNQSSFRYIPGKLGWSQSQAPQFFKDPAKQISMPETGRSWTFDPFSESLHCFIHSLGAVNGMPEYFLGAASSDNDPPAGFLFTAIDHRSLTPRFKELLYGDWNFVAPHVPGNGNATGVTAILAAISGLADNDYFLIASSDNPRMGNWEDSWLEALSAIGVDYSQVSDIENGQRVIIFGQKGALPGTATVVKEPNLPIGNEPPRHDLLIDLNSSYDSAQVFSTRIGPTDDWSEYQFDWSSLENLSGDELPTAVYGVRRDNSEQLILSGLEEGAHALLQVDASEFPFLRLEAEPMDPTFRTAPQLDRWEVFFNPAPDLAIDPAVAFSIPDTIEEGQVVSLVFGVRNVSQTPMDSLLVRFSIQRSDRSTFVLGEKRFAGFGPEETRELEFLFHSAGKSLEGEIDLITEINPDLDQLEQNQFNNYYFHSLYVKTDKVGPIVDVTVDGKHLMDGDIVSPEPEITIEINDENKYLPVAVSDSTFSILFGTERSAINLNPQVFIEGNAQIEQIPTRLPNNKARLIFRPGRLADGEYTLAVQGRDFKGNAGGQSDYVIHFNVENRKAISQVLPYPNPFSTSARFVYTLTGDEKPYVFEIYIYTIAGRLVKVIDLLALGEVHFGYNITDYEWDGRDEFGDPLANGVYIYKVKSKFRDRYGVEERDEGISDYFNNGFGKIYLMR